MTAKYDDYAFVNALRAVLRLDPLDAPKTTSSERAFGELQLVAWPDAKLRSKTPGS